MIGLLGKKLGMTQIFSPSGKAVPATVLEVGPCQVLALKTREKDGYVAVQLGFGPRKEKRTSKAEQGHFKRAGVSPKQVVREIRTDSVVGLSVGAQVGASLFQVGDIVDVVGVSIGKGFQGVVKRHHFRGGGASHGSMFGRVPGSIGSSSFPSRVFKGMRAAGHMGNRRTTVQNVAVVDVVENENLLVVKGQVPGHEGGFLVVRSAVKKPASRGWVPAQAAAREPEAAVEGAAAGS